MAGLIPVELQTPGEILLTVAERGRALRLERGWTQAELGRRAGISVETVKHFEKTGKITFERLISIAVVLGAVQPLGELFAPPPARTLDELERRTRVRQRAPRTRRKEPDAPA